MLGIVLDTRIASSNNMGGIHTCVILLVTYLWSHNNFRVACFVADGVDAVAVA